MLPTGQTPSTTRFAALPVWTCALLFAWTPLAACSVDGAIEIELDWPEPELRPSASEIFEITLVRTAAGEPSTRTVHRAPAPSGEVSLGTVAPGDDLRLAVELRSPNQRLIGYGRSRAGLDVAAGDSLTMTMNVRKPFLYVTGGPAIATVDPTADNTEPQLLAVVADPLVATTASDGSALYIVHGGSGAYQLSAFSTKNLTEPLFPSVALQNAPIDIAVSADGRFVAVAHAQGMSVVNTGRAGEELGAVTESGIGARVDRVTASPGVVPITYALLGRADTCGGTSRVVALDLSEPSTILGDLALSGSAQDIAAMAPTTDGQRPEALVADACAGEIHGLTLVGADPPVSALFAEVDSVTALATLDDRVWAVGSTDDPELGAALVATSMDLNGDDQSSLQVPVMQERAKTEDYSGPGDDAVRQMDADAVTAVHLGVFPGGDTLALTIDGSYFAPERGTIDVFGIELPILPEIQLYNREFVLLDVASATIIQRARTQCTLDVLSFDAVVFEWECGESPNQAVMIDPFVPTGLSILYGAN